MRMLCLWPRFDWDIAKVNEDTGRNTITIETVPLLYVFSLNLFQYVFNNDN